MCGCLRYLSALHRRRCAYGYDKAGNRSQVGTGVTAPQNYEVNNLNQLVWERDHGRTTFTGFLDEPATVTVNGNPAKVMSTNGGAPFKFEALVDLAMGANTVVVEARDGNDNLATKTYAVTTSGATKKYEYDANGNLRYEKEPSGTVIREYRWDQQNRLVRMLSATHESVYEYDGQSRRVRITEIDNSVQTKQETFIWCGSRICQKRSGSTVVRSYFAQGFEQGSDDYFYTRDHLGNVREVVGSDGTTVASRVSYDPWGKASESGAGAVTDFGFSGHYLDRPSGLNLPLYRGYSPSLGRWLSRDPIGIAGGLNLYGYVLNDPVDLSDPLGLDPVPTLWDQIIMNACTFFGYGCPDPYGPPPPPDPAPEPRKPPPGPTPAPGGGSPGGGSSGGGSSGGGAPGGGPPGGGQMCPEEPRPDNKCAEANTICTNLCEKHLGKNYRPARRGRRGRGIAGGGTDQQEIFMSCYNACMSGYGC